MLRTDASQARKQRCQYYGLVKVNLANDRNEPGRKPCATAKIAVCRLSDFSLSKAPMALSYTCDLQNLVPIKVLLEATNFVRIYYAAIKN